MDSMLDDELRKRVEKATVRFPKRGGQGVVVPGSLVLTAAHCIEWDLDGEMTLNENIFLEKINCDGRQIFAGIVVVEPVLDIAVLGEPYGHTFYEESNDYIDTLELIEPIEIRTKDLERYQAIHAFIFTHKRTWLEVAVQRSGNDGAPALVITGAPIEPGTSGSPVIDEEGRLIGVVSSCGTADPFFHGKIPRPNIALPVWVVDRILKKQS